MSSREAVRRLWKVGQAGHRVHIPDGYRVLDVGSGHNPFVRADVLLERFLVDDRDRAETPMDTSDSRIVVGDICAAPFADGTFDYAIASHVAEHVEDPIAFCTELSRIARGGYVEAPGWLGDRLLPEPFHRWRVTLHGEGLRFDELPPYEPSGVLLRILYAVMYYGERRPGHWSLELHRGLVGRLLRAAQLALAACWRLPLVRDATYTRLEWRGTLSAVVVGRNGTQHRTPSR